MSAEAQIQNGYLNATRSTGMPRDVEYQIFSRVTGRINRASRPGAPFGELVAALNENLSLWRTIALDVADPGNGLPEMLRARLFYMFEFTSAQTQRVLRREGSAEVLVDINTTIMRALRARQPQEPAIRCPA